MGALTRIPYAYSLGAVDPSAVRGQAFIRYPGHLSVEKVPLLG